jgi:hypothetical protein
MIIDAVLVLSDDQAITATADSENILDLGAANLALNEGTPLYANAILTTGFDTDTATLAVELHNADVNPPTTKHMELFPALAVSNLTTAQWLFRQPIGLINHDLNGRYLCYQYTASAALTSGEVFGWIGSH